MICVQLSWASSFGGYLIVEATRNVAVLSRVLTMSGTRGRLTSRKWVNWLRRTLSPHAWYNPCQLIRQGSYPVSNPSQPRNEQRYRRRRITWPVIVQADARRLHGETLDVGPQGAKLRLTERPDVGTCITLHLMPTDGHPMAIEAIVWRHDEEGVVVFFLSMETGIWEHERRPTGTQTGELSSNKTETILVVDDEVQVLDVVGDSLESGGYKVLKTVDPFEALRLARRGALPIHLLLTDVVMPLMHGVKLADEFRAIRPDAKVLFMSAYVTAEVEEYGAVLVPGVSLLIKPFGLPVLHDKVRSALNFRAPFPFARIS